MTQCLCASPTIAPLVIRDALMLSIRIWTEVRHYQNYPSQGTPNLQVTHGPSRKPSQIFGDIHQRKKRLCVMNNEKYNLQATSVKFSHFTTQVAMGFTFWIPHSNNDSVCSTLSNPVHLFINFCDMPLGSRRMR